VLALALVVLGGQTTARAAGEPVALVVPESADELVREAATRLRAELRAAGFDVRELRAEEGTEPDAQAAAVSPAPVATVAVVAEDGAAAADIWVVDRATHRTVVRHVDVSSVARKRAASVLAVRSVELLRASLIELFPTSKSLAEKKEEPKASPEGPEPKPKPSQPAAVKHEPATGNEGAAEPAERDRTTEPRASEGEQRRFRFGGELGAAALYGPGGVSAAFAPLLRASYGNATWSTRLGLVLPAFGAEVTGKGGKAMLREELVELDVAAAWPTEGRVAVIGSVGAGAYHFHVDGQGDAPNVGHDAERWGAVGKLGLGVMLRTGLRSGVVLDTDAVWLAPPIAIQIAGVTAGRSSQPTLCTSLGFQMAL
jgi:hypothetical protein